MYDEGVIATVRPVLQCRTRRDVAHVAKVLMERYVGRDWEQQADMLLAARELQQEKQLEEVRPVVTRPDLASPDFDL